MPSPAQAALLSWSVPPAATFALTLTALIYLRGWLLLRRAGVPFVPPWRAASFLLGLLSLWVALASPFDTLSGFLLTAHMLQHMTLMMIAPPLLLMGAPLIPLVRGLPVFAAREFAGPFLNWRVARRAGNALIHPAVALIIMGAAMFAWHTPRLYELALGSGSWHEFEHACFFLASLIFWWPVIQPWPRRSERPRWTVVPYLLIGDLQNTVLSAILVFSDRVLYPSYATTPRLFGLSAVADQVAAGAIMWVMGSIVFVIPAIIVAVQCLSTRKPSPGVVTRSQTPSFDAVFIVGRRLSFAPRMLRRRFSASTVEAITFVAIFVAAGLCLAALASGGPDDDDVALRLSQTSGPFVVSVFALPGDLDAGRSEFSVLVQDRDSLQVVQDANVELQATQTGASQATATVRASSDGSENKLLQVADVELPSEGNWTLRVRVARDGQSSELALPVRVAKPEAEVTIHGWYVVFVIVAGILALAYYRRQRSSKRISGFGRSLSPELKHNRIVRNG
jgi:cytochrome c oxidase assembly factor CtaG